MTEVTDLRLARLERDGNNKKISVEDLLRLALKDVATGRIGDSPQARPVSCFLCIVVEESDEVWSTVGYRCGLSRQEEIGLIELYKAQQVRKWQEAR